MNVVTINYSKKKAGFVLFFTGLVFALPFAFYFFNPVFFDVTNSSVGDVILKFGFFGFMLLAGAILSTALVRKFLSKAPALELSEAGIRSNVTELTEKFLPLDDISEAVMTFNHKGHKILHVHIKEAASASHTELFINSRLFKVKPAMRIYHELLDSIPEDVANTINQYLENTNEADVVSDTKSGTLADYVNRAA